MAYSPSLGYLGYVPQVTLGTPLAPTKFCRLEAMDGVDQLDVQEYWDGVARNAAFAAKLKQFYQGSFKTFWRPDTGTQLFCYAMGGTDAKTGVADPFTHTSSETNADLQLLTFEQGYQNQNLILRTQDALIEELSVESKGAGIAEMDVKFIGTVDTPQGSATSVAFETDRPLQMCDATFTPTGATFVSGDVTRWKVTIKNTINQVPRAGSLYPRLIYGTRMISLEVDVLVPSIALFSDIFFGGDAATAAIIAPTVMGSLVGVWDLAGTPDHQISLTVNNTVLKGAKPPFDVKGKPFILPFTGAVLRTGGTAPLVLAGKNAVSTAY